MFPACALSFSMGFLSLSLEILWIRLFGFANYSMPQAFAFVLFAYLIGIACGASIGKKLSCSFSNLWLVSGIVLIFSSLFDLISPWCYAHWISSTWQIEIGGLLIAMTALLKAILFPIAHHLGLSEKSSQTGQAVSRVYVSNILGATLGPIFTGLILLDHFSTQQSFILCAGLTFLISQYCLFKSSIRLAFLSLPVITAFFIIHFAWIQNHDYLINTLAQRNYTVHRIIENKQGIITLYQDAKNGDIVFGGNVYDGRTNLDPANNSNQINRVLILPAIKEKPESVLVIGLSIGTWLKLITSFPGVKKMDVIEINPGYLKAIQDYPAQASALRDPRVHLYIADGRQWLKLHPNNKYDLIIMNTSFYWRAYASTLLSYEFLTLIKSHMKPNALLTYNTTLSPDAFKTATQVFSHAYLYENFVIAANFDWRNQLYLPSAQKRLAALQLDGKPVFSNNSATLIQSFLTIPLISIEEIQDKYKKLSRNIETVTDNNLITEYKYGKQL